MKQRHLLLLPLGASLLLAGGEFWNDKEPGQWSEKEIERLLTRSPWAKEATAAMDFSRMMGGPGGMPGGGPPGGGMPGGGGPPGGMMGGGPPGGMPPGGGPPGGGMGMPGGMPEFKAVIRWESAGPVRGVSKIALPENSTAAHVVSVTGLPMMGGGPGGRRPDGAQREQMMEQLKATTALSAKGKPDLHPFRVHADEHSGALLFFFAKEADITEGAKDVSFTCQLGPMQFKSKFVMKEMSVKGQRAI